MKYRIARKIQLERYFGERLKYESAEFCVEADTKEEAEKEMNAWKKEYLKKLENSLIKPPFVDKK